MVIDPKFPLIWLGCEFVCTFDFKIEYITEKVRFICISYCLP